VTQDGRCRREQGGERVGPGPGGRGDRQAQEDGSERDQERESNEQHDRGRTRPLDARRRLDAVVERLDPLDPDATVADVPPLEPDGIARRLAG